MRRRAAATVALAFLLSLGSACGSEDGVGDGAAPETPADDQAAIQTLFADYNSALDSGEFAEVCAMNTEQFNEELVTEVREAFGDATPTCPQALEVMAVEGGSAQLRDIEVSGGTAEGMVGPSTWRFARVSGSWKVAFAN
jgi:hypothetical protein